MGKDEAISLAQYVDQTYIKFMFNSGPLGFVEPTPGNAKYVAEQLQSKSLGQRRGAKRASAPLCQFNEKI